jgi:ubiquinone/menaquinone biosynthesis C-methylase UbiE
VEIETNEQSAFWSKVAEKYDSVVDLQIGPGTRAMVRRRLAREDRLGAAAEFGCGSGFFTSALAARAERVVATDLSRGMVALARQRTTAANVRFQQEDCQKTSLADASLDTAFMSLVIHFTEPAKCLAEMHRILKSGGHLIIANLDPEALSGWSRISCRIRVIFQGVKGYRTRPPKGLGDNVMTERKLCDLLVKSGFKIICAETFRSSSSSSNIPVEYIKAMKLENGNGLATETH